MTSTASGKPRNVRHMVSYFEKRGDQTVTTARSRKRQSVIAIAMMNFTRRPWEHFPRRKSSSSTNPRRRSSTSNSTASESTTYETAEEQLADSFYAPSERSGTSTVISEDRRWSVNPDYDWEHDEIANLKDSLRKISLSSGTPDAQLKEGDMPSDAPHVESPAVQDVVVGTAPPGVHEIDFGEQSAAQAAKSESTSSLNRETSGVHHETVNEVKVSHLETLNDGFDEAESTSKPVASDSKVPDDPQSPNQIVGAKVPIRTSSASKSSKVGQLRVKTTHSDKERKSADATSPSSPSPKSKTRPKLALDLPGIPESDAETLVRQRRPSLSMLQQFPGRPQTSHANRQSRPPVSLRRYPVRSISAPLPGQPPRSPTQMMELVSQRHVKFTHIREEKLRRLSSMTNGDATQGSKSFMGRRHASAPVAETVRRRRSGLVPAGRPSLAQRLSFSRRRQSVSQAIREYIRSPRRRPSLFFSRRSRSVTR